MNESVLLWILPGFFGYISYVQFRRSYPVHKGNWDFVVSLGVFSVFSQILTKKIFDLSISDSPTTTISILTTICVAFILGLLSAILFNVFVAFKKIKDPSDLFTQKCEQLLEKAVLIVLKNSKYYVAAVVEFDDFSRGESTGDRTILILPFKSGVINSDGLLSCKKDYSEQELKTSVRPILLFVREIESLREYNTDMERRFSAAPAANLSPANPSFP